MNLITRYATLPVNIIQVFSESIFENFGAYIKIKLLTLFIVGGVTRTGDVDKT